MTACAQLQRQPTQHERRHGRKAADVAGKWRHARSAEARAVALADEIEKPAHIRKRFTVGY